jgi:hypothetical protein
VEGGRRKDPLLAKNSVSFLGNSEKRVQFSIMTMFMISRKVQENPGGLWRIGEAVREICREIQSVGAILYHDDICDI